MEIILLFVYAASKYCTQTHCPAGALLSRIKMTPARKRNPSPVAAGPFQKSSDLFAEARRGQM